MSQGVYESKVCLLGGIILVYIWWLPTIVNNCSGMFQSSGTYTIPTLGPKVHKFDLLWATWSPRVLLRWNTTCRAYSLP